MGNSVAKNAKTKKTEKTKKGGPHSKEEKARLKVAYIEQLVKCGCIASAAQRALHLSPITVKAWSDEDAEFKEAIDNAEALSVGEATSLLWESMKEGNATSIIFYLKTRGAKYGFAEKQQIDLRTLAENLPRGLNGIGEQ